MSCHVPSLSEVICLCTRLKNIWGSGKRVSVFEDLQETQRMLYLGGGVCLWISNILLKGIVHAKLLSSLIQPQAEKKHLTFFLQWNIEGDVLKNVQAVLFHSMKVELQYRQKSTIKHHKSTLYFDLCHIFPVLSHIYSK